MIHSDGFYDYAWNPVEGCLHGCPYCYAKRSFDIRGLDFKPTFYEDRLNEPSQVGPCGIFVTHYTDLMGDFIPLEWVNKILDVCRSLPKHTFIFITKNPISYYKYSWPDNCIIGVTIESPEKFWRSKIIEELNVRKMVSIEPIFGSFDGFDFSQFELVVIGDLMYEKSKTCIEWVNSVNHSNIFYKPNVRKYLI